MVWRVKSEGQTFFLYNILFTSKCENTSGNGKALNDYFKTLVPV
jgi:hypothetical protein